MRSLNIAFLTLLSITLAGCGGTPPPHGRIGGLPYPGAWTLYKAADPEKLGFHRYDQGTIPLPPYEADRGLIYTCNAGFVDVAHLRTAVDWTRYYADHVRAALKDKAKGLDLSGPNYSRFVFKFDYPADWGKLKKEDRQNLIDELSARVGQRTAYAAVTWHEVITWYGYKGSLVVDESPSSFTWDDVMSHVVGTRVGAAAWRVVNVEKRKGVDFNRAVTDALDAEMKTLHAVKPAETTAAAKAVEGKWWRDGKPLKRQLNIGLTSGRVTPWLVPGLPFCPAPPPSPAPVAVMPTLADVNGRDFRGLCTVEIDPQIGQTNKILSKLPGKHQRVDVDADLPLLVEAVRAEMRGQYGEGFDRP